MNKKILVLIGTLLVLVILPKSLDAALDPVYTINSTGRANPLYANYIWHDDAKTGYLTESEKAGKNNLKCDNNDIERWYGYYHATCGLDPTKRPNVTSCSPYSVAADGRNFIEARKNCLNTALSRKASGTCYFKDGSYANLFINNDTIGYKGEDGLTANNIGKKYGIWAKTNPNSNMYTQSTGVRTKCTWGGSDITSQKTLVQNMYSTTTGVTAYCVNPGRAFVNGSQYEKIGTFDVTKCTEGSKTYECGLAAIVMESEKNYGSDYLTTLTALRLWAAEKGQGDGWYDSTNSKVYTTASIYKITADYVLSNGYSGSVNDPGIPGVIYADAGSASALSNGISIYQKVSREGYSGFVPKVENKVAPEFNTETNTLPVLLESNFDMSQELAIDSIISKSFGTVTDYEKIPCESDASKYCLLLNISIDPEQIRNLTSDEITINYNYPDDIITKIGFYKHVGNPSAYQYMLLFDRGAKSQIKITYNWELSICKIKDGIYYDAEGRPTDYDGFRESCACVEIDGVKYIEYPDRPAVNDEEFDRLCNRVQCPDEGIKKDMPQDCEEDGSTGTMKDPEICNILNREDANYKTDYGNEYCTIYCRETLKFTFMSKEEAIAGRAFQYNLKYRKSNIEHLSTVILSSRQCSSIIDYKTWEDEYIEANNKVLNTWNELKYWESLYNLNGGRHTDEYPGGGCWRCGCEQEHIKDITIAWKTGVYTRTNPDGTYDYNIPTSVSKRGTDARCPSKSCDCVPLENGGRRCFCCSSPCTPAKQTNYRYVIEHYNSAVTDYKDAVRKRDELLYKLQDCNFMSDATKVYTKGTFYVSRADGYYVTPAVLKTYNFVIDYKPENDVEIDYEENYTYDKGYEITTPDEWFDPDVVKIGYAKMEDSEWNNWENYCTNCDNDFEGLRSESYTKDLPYWECDKSDGAAKCKNVPKKMPSNTLTNIVLESGSIHYQGSEFYTQVYTGNISTSQNGVGYWIKMDDYSYPVAMERRTGDYGVHLEYKNLGRQDRIVKFDDGEFYCSYAVRNDLAVFDCDDDYHTCYPCEGSEDCYNGNSSDLGVYFRTIDLSDIFPNSQYSPINNNRPQAYRRVGLNWTVNNAVAQIEKIQDLGNDIWTEATPQYSVTLSPSQIKAIQKYNKTLEESGYGYLDYSLTCGSNLQCTSNFLKDDLREIMKEKYETNYINNSRNLSKRELYFYTR